MNPLLKLAEEWRSQAEMLRRYGDERGATVCELHAGELEAAWHSWQIEELTFGQAAEESGYAADSIGRLVREGKIPAASGKVRRCDLPRKATARNGVTASNIVNCKEQIARSVADSKEGARDG